MLSCECQINNYTLIYILHDHGPAPTIDFHAMICVIGHCFLEHRCHDIIRKANSTFQSADRSSFKKKKACLPVFKRVRLILKIVSTIFSFDKMRGDNSTQGSRLPLNIPCFGKNNAKGGHHEFSC